MSLPIVFREIRVKTMETNSGIFIGINFANGWDSNNKNQMSIKGGENNRFPNNVNIFNDNDVIDTQIRTVDKVPLLPRRNIFR
jgi:hypothetical protein